MPNQTKSVSHRRRGGGRSTLKTIKTERIGNSHIPVASLTKLIKKTHIRTLEMKSKSGEPFASTLIPNLDGTAVSPLVLGRGGESDEREGDLIQSLFSYCKFTLRNVNNNNDFYVRFLVLMARAGVVPTDDNTLQDADKNITALTGSVLDLQREHNTTDFIKLRDKVWYLPQIQNTHSHWSNKYVTISVKHRRVLRYPTVTPAADQDPVANNVWYIWFATVPSDELPGANGVELSANQFHYFKDK